MKTKSKGFWEKLKSPSARYSVLTLLGLGFIGGIAVLSGFLGELHASAQESFCISCHEMEENVYMEYKNTAHFSNKSGVRATCADCHLARDLGPKLARKTVAARELFNKIKGTIDTREKFLDHRLTMATRVWKEMKANDSRECRSCHDAQAMDYYKQSRRARLAHIRGDNEKLTCIDCHKGIAHLLPDMTGIDPSAVIGNRP
ncbi:NapC/NirT family cytochrome c [Thiovibrio frasassiensis]|uniref:Cytochrome c-type protein n=1 Tax=Thiovibrio frasassiensis TaxID=2984131 RepID=A0A9X4MMW7_9BACT|nr:NapC/NirT family cytochrome c [Thiovibrio frasassiensis]MDG4475637.1 NapC/NirT family cytochrome c [Thiovibrio frasassiensis]